ncbi:MAG TPA: AraC family transcriptional regulator, partial [Clostridium sp.]|nr:AraC family transcriptional regulator [Clostridium sp.]
IKYLRNHMVAHENMSYSLEKFTKENDISLSLFKNGFKKIYGDTPYSYIRKYKMNKAAVLLKTSKDTNINDIAILLGYKNASKFSKAFKEVIGVTPREYKMKS